MYSFSVSRGSYVVTFVPPTRLFTNLGYNPKSYEVAVSGANIKLDGACGP